MRKIIALSILAPTFALASEEDRNAAASAYAITLSCAAVGHEGSVDRSPHYRDVVRNAGGDLVLSMIERSVVAQFKARVESGETTHTAHLADCQLNMPEIFEKVDPIVGYSKP